MKRILLFAAIALSMVSCLTKGSYSQSYTADITFEYQDQVYKNEFGKDSVYVCPKEEDQGFLYLQFPLFFGQRQAGGKLAGGFVMSYLTGEKDGLLEKEPSANDEFLSMRQWVLLTARPVPQAARHMQSFMITRKSL